METLAIERETMNPMVARAAAPHRSARVLLAEDDVLVRRLIARGLRRAGFPVIEAADGAEVLERIETTIWHDRTDVIGAIVADMAMPALTGLDVLAALRGAGLQTPFILVTAFGDVGVHQEAIALGAAAVLDKPFPMHALARALRTALGPRDTRRPVVQIRPPHPRRLH